MRKDIQKKPILQRKKLNGSAIFVEIMRALDPAFRSQILKRLESANPLLARLGEACLFMFDDLARLDDRSMQIALRVVDEKQLLMAWRMTPKHLQSKILENMSQQRREQFLEDIDNLPTRIPKLQAIRAQQAIASQLRKVLKEGGLTLSSKRNIATKHR